MEPLTDGLVGVLSAAAARLRASLRCVDDLVGGVSAAADDLDDALVTASSAADDLDGVLALSCFSAGILFSVSVRMSI